MNSLPIFVFTFWLRGGLNYNFSVSISSSVLSISIIIRIDEKFTLSFSAISYTDLTLPTSSLLQDKSEILLLIILGNC